MGKQLRAVQVDLARAEAALAAELLADGWEHKAPKRLLKGWLARQANVSTRILRLTPEFHLGDDDLHAWEQSGSQEEV